MLFSKAYVRKTKRGSVIKVLKEHYLRDDIYCGVPGCQRCPEHTTTLSAEPRQTTAVRSPHYIVPDTNILYHQIDVMEHAAFVDVIVLQTVLEELRHRSLPVYNRVRALTAEPARRFFVFCNEHHRETFVQREPEETPNDRNDRGKPFNRRRPIRRAVEWYSAHIDSKRAVVLITDDRANRAKAKDAGITALSLRQYVESLSGFPELVDMVAAVGGDDDDDMDASAADKKFVYPEHLSPTQISAGLKSGAFHQGVLNISAHNFLEGSSMIRVNNEEVIVQIIGRENLNRGVQGDVVALQILPKSEWRSGVSTVLEEEVVEKDDLEEPTTDAATVDKTLDKALQEPATEQELKPTARIVGIIKRNWRPFCGTIDASSVHAGSTSTQMQSVFFWALDKRIPKIRIRTRQAQSLLGKRIVVAIDAWTKNSRYPAGHYVRTLGEVGDRATETEVLLLEHDVPFAPFSPLVLSFLPEEGEAWVVRDDLHLANREDFRSWDVCSIDPPGCTDIDDALHARLLPNGNYSVGVHIADVSHFVKTDNAMDLEARRRGTTVYLVDKRIDMLPGLLGTNLCSLRSNVDRLAFSCLWEITPDAEVVSTRFTKSVIRSKASLTYDEAQARLDDPKMTDSVSMSIKALNMLAKKLRARRMAAGALTLASPEVRFRMENDSQDPVDVELKELKDTNALVEEFMLLANIYVARKIYECFPECSMLRRHPKPPATNFEDLGKALEPFGVKIDASTSRTLSDSLDAAVDPNDPYFNKLVRIMTTRCMMQAVYFCSGTLAEPDFWHYGLATDIYTHFTSPIRRYADLVVHRLLAASIGYDKTYSSELTDKAKVKEMSDVLNYRNRMAQQASRSSVELYTNLFFKGKTVVEEAYVIRILKNGCSLLIPKYGVESFVYAAPVPNQPPLLALHPTMNALTGAGPDGEVVIKLFDKVRVQVTVEEAGVAAAQRSKLVLRLVEPNVPGMCPVVETSTARPLGGAATTPARTTRPAKKPKRK
ncbi:exosome catalytic subunit dis3 [Polyrhizophydium stewartii]|uniref:Exosome catalytic subunit dis3 n=1 Tax=Polyrhizophydium stewartii TaxID=2732419 RepID=A0ABR4MZG2_9FUNG